MAGKGSGKSSGGSWFDWFSKDKEVPENRRKPTAKEELGIKETSADEAAANQGFTWKSAIPAPLPTLYDLVINKGIKNLDFKNGNTWNKVVKTLSTAGTIWGALQGYDAYKNQDLENSTGIRSFQDMMKLGQGLQNRARLNSNEVTDDFIQKSKKDMPGKSWLSPFFNDANRRKAVDWIELNDPEAANYNYNWPVIETIAAPSLLQGTEPATSFKDIYKVRPSMPRLRSDALNMGQALRDIGELSENPNYMSTISTLRDGGYVSPEDKENVMQALKALVRTRDLTAKEQPRHAFLVNPPPPPPAPKREEPDIMSGYSFMKNKQ